MMVNPEESGCSLLIVDDEYNARQGLKRILKVVGSDTFECTVFEAENAAAALETIERETVDVVLLDYRMPGTNGLDMLESIVKQHPLTAVIMITGAGSEEVAVDAMKKGAVDYLVKGRITPQTLQRSILSGLEKVRLHHILQRQQEELIELERHRVMVESMGAACHHLGQPATALLGNLELLKQQAVDEDMAQTIQECLTAAHKIGQILLKMQKISDYQTVQYDAGPPDAEGIGRILKI